METARGVLPERNAPSDRPSGQESQQENHSLFGANADAAVFRFVSAMSIILVHEKYLPFVDLLL